MSEVQRASDVPAQGRRATIRPEDLEAVTIPVGDLAFYPGNARQGDVGAICQSLEAHGQFRPLVVQRSTGHVLAGNHTLRAMRELGWPAAAVTYLDVDDEQAKRIVAVDNRSQDLATYDDAALASLLQELAATPDGLTGTGFDGDDLDDLLADLEGGGAEPDGAGTDTDPGEPPAEPRTKPGDVWVLGDHRLTCGDATDVLAVERAVRDERAALVYTDPPYGVDYQGGANQEKRERLAGDGAGTTIYADVLPIAEAYSDSEAPLYLWFAGTKGAAVYSAVEAAGYTVRALLVWHKLKAHYGAFMSQYMPKHEPVLYCVKKGTPPRWHGPTNEVTVWEHDQPAVNEWYPTQKPVELAERAMANSSLPGDVVLDLFGGSGSTLIAAENIGRRARLIELDPRYCDVIVDRWERHTGKTAVLEGDHRRESTPALGGDA